jgi:predicted N-acetyltransferase YhbS
MESIIIRPFQKEDWEALWQILRSVFKEGETYTFSPDISEEEAYSVWITLPQQTYVAMNKENSLIGTYFIKPNQATLGAHICNCGYIVSSAHRGKGIAKRLCLHSLEQAKILGFKGMQFNAVVSTNPVAVALWLKLGFAKIGTVPGGFKSQTYGYVDTYIMFKSL